MTSTPRETHTVTAVDSATRELIQLAVVIACGDEREIRSAMARAAGRQGPPAAWVEELILQSYLVVGFPRTLNAAREWRRASGRRAPPTDPGADYGHVRAWEQQGEATCARVYGRTYRRLRVNIRDLHPALDAWMIVDGYGKVLSRPGLDLRRRELCIVAVCAAHGQERQLHAHLRGALNAGTGRDEVDEVLALVAPRLSSAQRARFRQLWERVGSTP